MKRRANSPLLWCLGLALCVVIAVLTANTALSWGKMGAARPSPALAQAGEADTAAARSEQPEQPLCVYLPLLVAHYEPYVFLDAWGAEIGFFSSPQGITVSGGRVYVADTDNHRVQIFDVDGRPLSAFGTLGSGEGQFDSPKGIAVDGQGNIYVADTGNNRVQKFDSDGNYPTHFGSRDCDLSDWAWGVPTSGPPGAHSGTRVWATNLAGSYRDNQDVYLTSPDIDLTAYASQALILSWWGWYQGDDCCDFISVDVSKDGGTSWTRVYGEFSGGQVNEDVWEQQKVNLDASFAVPNLRVRFHFRSDNSYTGPGWYIDDVSISADSTTGRPWDFEAGDGGFTAGCKYVLGEPVGIAVDGQGHVYVAEYGNHRVQKFTSEGVYLTQWGSAGNGDGQFDSPSGVAVDGQGHVFVVDTDNHRVQKFTSDGVYLTRWGSQGSTAGQFNDPNGIAVDGQGHVYVADTGNNRVQKFTSDGSYLTRWGSYGTGAGQFNAPLDIAVDGQENVYVADWGNNRVQKLSSNWIYLTQWGSYSTRAGQFNVPLGIVVDGQGYIYVVDSWNHRVQRFTSEGSYLTQWGSEGSGEGQFIEPAGIAVDEDGNVYVVDRGNHRVQKFTSDGVYLTQWGSRGSGDGQFDYPWGIAVDGQGNVYVADSGNARVQKFTSDGSYLTQWGEWGSGDGQFNGPTGIAVDGDGNVYVTELGADIGFGGYRVQKFTSQGVYLTQLGGEYTCQFAAPYGVAVDGQGKVYVADAAAFLSYDGCGEPHRVKKFTSQGAYLTQWGGEGSGEGQFLHPRGIAVDGQGNVYVTDKYNQRVQKFAADYPTPDPLHGLALNGSFEETPDLARWAYGGELPVTLVTTPTHGLRAARLGTSVPQTEQPRGMAWLRQTMYIRPEWDRPLLSFRYRMFVNDIIHYSDFHVWLARTNGSWLAEITRDGFRSCQGNVAPPAGYDLGWRTASYDLSPFKGQNVRLVFENRNLHDSSWGIWTVVDEVRVVDAGPLPDLPGPYRQYFPLSSRCTRTP